MTHRALHGRSSLVSRTALYVCFILFALISVNISHGLDSAPSGQVSGRANSPAHSASAIVSSAHQSLTGRNVVIGIYDSGINLDNPVFTSQGNSRVISQSCVGSNSEVNLCNTDPARAAQNTCTTTDIGCFHGMAVAGLAAGNAGIVKLNGAQVDVGGVAPDANISYVRDAMSKDGTIQYNDFVNALNKFVDDVKSGSPAAPDVVNLSLGFPRSSYRDCQQDNASKRAIDFLVNSGVVVVAASGNESNKNEITYPACMKNVIAVGSSAGDKVSSFSNMSGDIDLVAPGENQWAHLSETSRFVTVKGTSFAAPLVSGAVALIKQKNPSMSPSAVQDLLMSTADNAVDPATGTSYKRLNVDNALEKISPTPPQAKVADAQTAPAPATVAVSTPENKVAVPAVRLNSQAVGGVTQPDVAAVQKNNNVDLTKVILLALLLCGIGAIAATAVLRRKKSTISSYSNEFVLNNMDMKHLE